MVFPTIEVSPRAAIQAQRGSLWIFSNEMGTKMPDFPPGTWCGFVSQGRFVGSGYFNPHSLIAGRIVSFEKHPDPEPLVVSRLNQAILRRNVGKENEAARLVFSEADFLPGLILDWFSGVLVVQTNTAGADLLAPIVEKHAPQIIFQKMAQKVEALVVRGDTSIRKLEGIDDFVRISFGEESRLKEAVFKQDGVLGVADLLEGQKTGYFLDQRENRRFLDQPGLSSGLSVLDLFCYSGAWGIRALAKGAANVTFVDESAQALELVRKGLVANHLPVHQANVVRADVFEFLERESSEYDLIIADPPAFVKSKKNLPQALKAYEKLNRLAWRRLKKGGVLVSCSCSFHVSESDFMEMLGTAVSKEKSLAHVAFRGGQASDHPVLLSMPETRYLKCVALKRISAGSQQ